MTKGDNHSIRCPSCKICILRIFKHFDVELPDRGEISEWQGPCPSCGVELHFWARMAVALECELERKVK